MHDDEDRITGLEEDFAEPVAGRANRTRQILFPFRCTGRRNARRQCLQLPLLLDTRPGENFFHDRTKLFEEFRAGGDRFALGLRCLAYRVFERMRQRYVRILGYIVRIE